MPYRRNLKTPSGTGSLVTVRTYLEPMAAKLDAARLQGEGIEAHVFDEGLHNVIVPGSVSGVRLQVRGADLERAAALLDDDPASTSRDDGEGEGVVRCPRCELAYCFHERANIEGSSAATALVFFLAPLLFLRRKRWHCHKCGHVWDDPKEGPAAMTQLADDEPDPIFRLRRAHGGMGLFLGLLVGFLGGMGGVPLAVEIFGRGSAAAALPFIFFFGAPILGVLIGRSLTYDVCSIPSCRTPLSADREDCPRCKGVIAGVIRTAEEHYAAAADVRREFAALCAEGADRPAKKAKGKKKKKRDAPA